MKILNFITCAAALIAATPVLAGQSDLTGTFEGGYECVQGVTWLKLETNAQSNGMMTAFFSFGSAAENGRTINSVPEGKFALRGSWSGNSFRLDPDYWIDQPTGFSMVPLKGELNAKGGLAGDVLFEGCSVFSVKRK